MRFDNKRRMAEIHFTFPRKGKYYIAPRWSGVNFVFKDNKEWLKVEAYIGLQEGVSSHNQLYLSWNTLYDHRLQVEEELRKRKEAGLFIYAFQVK